MTFVRGFAAEVRKGMIGLLAGWREVLLEMITFPLFYLLVVLFMGRGQLRADLLPPVLLGMVALTFVHEQVNRVFWSYLGDIRSGVLEQTYLTPLPSAASILGRQVAAVIAAVPAALAVLATGVAAVALQGGRLPLDAQVIVPLAAIVLGTCGLALILCGLCLVLRRIEIVTQLSVALYAVAGGTLVPLAAMPEPVAFLSRLVVPITPGIEAMRDILLGGYSLAALPTGWGLGWLLAQPLLITAAGVVLFHRLENVARRRGTLARS
ncbi:ABC transporter permease [Nonomuraea sp. NPDC050227]|uniref:ABC transporter permease n=1 Tax=Nonomuraea sp. NPDC050227 TaxID=3364360 RepID=UPI0037B41F1C